MMMSLVFAIPHKEESNNGKQDARGINDFRKVPVSQWENLLLAKRQDRE